MIIPDDTPVINLHMAFPAPVQLGLIATRLEECGSVYVKNAGASGAGTGTCSLHLGINLQSMAQISARIHQAMGEDWWKEHCYLSIGDLFEDFLRDYTQLLRNPPPQVGQG